MTTERITIIVNEKGARIVKRDIQAIGKGATKGAKGVNQLNRALGGLSVAFGARILSGLVDDFTVLETRLGNIVGTGREYNRVFGDLFRVAQRDGAVLTGLADTFVKLNVSLSDSVASSVDLVKVTDILARGFAASGTAASTAAGATLQLTQGLATDFKAAGQELNSIIEGAPLLAKVIAENLGGTSAVSLKKFAEEGKLTAKIFLDAIIASEDAIFAFKIPATIERSIQRLKNAFLVLLGESVFLRKATIVLTDALDALAGNLEPLIRAILAAAGAWIFYRAMLLLALGFNVLAVIVPTIGAFFSLALGVTTAAEAFALLSIAIGGPAGFLILLAAGVGAAIFFRDEIRASLIAVLAETIIFADKAVAAIQRFIAFSTSGIAASSIAIQNSLGLISDEVAQAAILDLAGGDVSAEGLFGVSNEDIRRAKEEMIAELSRTDRDTKFDFGEFIGIDTSAADALAKLRAEALERQADILKDIREPQLTYNNMIADLNVLFADGKITLDEFNQSLAEQELQFLKTAEATTFAQGFVNQIRKMQLETRNATAQMGEDFSKIFGPGGDLSKGIANAVAQSIVFGQSWKQSIQQVGQAILTQIISSLVQIGVNMLLNAALGKVILASQTAASVAAATTTAAAWAPAAAAVSLASFGTNAAPASAGIAATFALSKGLSALGGFQRGGFTGNLGQSQVAGLVHGQEFVVNAAATARNRAALEAINRGERVSTPDARPVNINIINEIPDAQFETRQINAQEVEIIAKRIVTREAPGVIAADLGNPNSRTSKSLAKNTQSNRRRF